jgi:hypothetical protein
MKSLRLTFVLVLGLLLPVAARAQEVKAKKYSDVKWYRVVNMTVETGKRGEIIDIVQNHFMKASSAAGTAGPAMVLMSVAGPWDFTVIWELPDGPSDLEWDISPRDEKWFAALTKQEGGAKQAQDLYQKFMGLIERSQSYIAVQRNSWQ